MRAVIAIVCALVTAALAAAFFVPPIPPPSAGPADAYTAAMRVGFTPEAAAAAGMDADGAGRLLDAVAVQPTLVAQLEAAVMSQETAARAASAARTRVRRYGAVPEYVENLTAAESALASSRAALRQADAALRSAVLESLGDRAAADVLAQLAENRGRGVPIEYRAFPFTDAQWAALRSALGHVGDPDHQFPPDEAAVLAVVNAASMPDTIRGRIAADGDRVRQAFAQYGE